MDRGDPAIARIRLIFKRLVKLAPVEGAARFVHRDLSPLMSSPPVLSVSRRQVRPVTASEAVTLRIDRDELRAAGRRAHSAGKLSDEQLARIEALCEGEPAPSGKPTVDLADGSISSELDLDSVEVEWVNVPFPQGGLVSSPPPPMPRVGEISAEWLSDSLVIEGEASGAFLSDSVVIEGDRSVQWLGDSAVIEAEQSASWLGDSQILEGEDSAVVLGDSAVIEQVEVPALMPTRAALESFVPHEEWPPSSAPASDEAPSLPRAHLAPAPAPYDDSAAPAPAQWDWASRQPSSDWAPAPSSDWAPAANPDYRASHGRMEAARYPGDDGAADEDACVTNQPEGWAHVGTSVVGRVESPWSDDKAITLPPPRALPSPFPRAFDALPIPAAPAAPSPRAMLAAERFDRVDPAPMRIPSRHGLPTRNGTLLSAQPSAASVSSGFAPLHAGTKLRKPLVAGDASAVLAGQPGADPNSITAKYPWLGPVLFAAALILGLIGEWMISSAPAAPPVAAAVPKAETAQVVQPSSLSTPSITLVAAPANVR